MADSPAPRRYRGFPKGNVVKAGQVRRTVGALLPPFIKGPLRKTRDFAKTHVAPLAYHGTGRFCPICEKPSRRFARFGSPALSRNDALCMRCGSLERHRLLWLYLKKKTDLFDGKPKKVLHVAPESCLEPKLRQQLGAGYITADLFNPSAMVKVDIMDIAFPDQTFDVIYCSHVLEHVANDRKAMREFHRVLKRDGWAILLVPVLAEKTFEDPTIIDPEARLQAFGQSDHVRIYGPDYIDRLRDAGFKVEMTRVTDLVARDDVSLMGLGPLSGEIYLCTK
jgi:SAM-dependent methyltransferase